MMIRNFKFTAAAVMGAAAVGLTAGDASAQELLVELRGNGSLQNTGSMDDAYFFGDTAVGEGLAGAGAGFDNVQEGGIKVPNPGDAMDGLQSLTISMFVKSSIGVAGTDDTQFFFMTEHSDNTMLRGRPSGRVQLQLVGQNETSTTSSSASLDYVDITDEWMFVAVTADGPSGEANFYLGTESSGELVLEGSRTGQPNWAPLEGVGEDIIFLNSKWNTRGLMGSMDNIRMHGSYTDSSGALTASQLDELFHAGLAEIPEPGSLALLGAGGLMLLGRRRRTA